MEPLLDLVWSCVNSKEQGPLGERAQAIYKNRLCSLREVCLTKFLLLLIIVVMSILMSKTLIVLEYLLPSKAKAASLITSSVQHSCPVGFFLCTSGDH